MFILYNVFILYHPIEHAPPGVWPASLQYIQPRKPNANVDEPPALACTTSALT